MGSSDKEKDSTKPHEGNKDPLVGRVLSDRYELLELIGEGGAGLIYRAKHIGLDKIVAVKVLLPQLRLNKDKLNRFKQEAAATSKLSHPNIVVVHDYGTIDNDHPFIVMDLLDGRELDTLINEGGRVPVDHAHSIFMQICDAMIHAHKANLIHRDLKPQNVMLTRSDGAEVVKVVDFGLAKILGQPGDEDYEKLTRTGHVFGTPQYMSPEQIRSQSIDARSDVYAMGCLMYETLTGRVPIMGTDSIDTLQKQLSDMPAGLGDLDCAAYIKERLDLIVLKCLEKQPDARYQSMSELKDDLEKVLEPPRQGALERISNLLKVSTVRWRHYQKAGAFSRSSIWTAVLISLIGGLAVAAGIFFLAPMNEDSDPDISWFLEEKKKESVSPEKIRQEEMLSTFFVQRAEELHGNSSPKLAAVLERKAHFLIEKDQYERAAALYERALAIRMKMQDPSSIDVGWTCINLATCYFKMKRYGEARPLYEKGLEIVALLMGNHFMEEPVPQSQLAFIYLLDGDDKKAQEFYQKAQKSWNMLGMTNTKEYTLVCSRLGDIFRKQGNFNNAAAYYKLALGKWQGFQGPEQQNYAICLYKMATLLEEQGKLSEADKYYQKAIAAFEENPDAPEYSTILRRYADFQWARMQWWSALEFRAKVKERKRHD